MTITSSIMEIIQFFKNENDAIFTSEKIALPILGHASL
jgi:hypothetical protein